MQHARRDRILRGERNAPSEGPWDAAHELDEGARARARPPHPLPHLRRQQRRRLLRQAGAPGPIEFVSSEIVFEAWHVLDVRASSA